MSQTRLTPRRAIEFAEGPKYLVFQSRNVRIQSNKSYWATIWMKKTLLTGHCRAGVLVMPNSHVPEKASTKHDKRHHHDSKKIEWHGKSLEKYSKGKYEDTQPGPAYPIGWRSEALGVEYRDITAKFHTGNNTAVDISYVILCQNNRREGMVYFDSLKLES